MEGMNASNCHPGLHIIAKRSGRRGLGATKTTYLGSLREMGSRSSPPLGGLQDLETIEISKIK